MNESHQNPITDELLSAYIDGDVTAAEQQQIEYAIARDPEIAWQVETLRQTVALLHALPAIPLSRSFVIQEEQVADVLSARRYGSVGLASNRRNGPSLWRRLLVFLNGGNLALRNASALAAALFIVVTVGRATLFSSASMAPMSASYEQTRALPPSALDAQADRAATISGAPTMSAQSMAAESAPTPEALATEASADATSASATPDMEAPAAEAPAGEVPAPASGESAGASTMSARAAEAPAAGAPAAATPDLNSMTTLTLQTAQANPAAQGLAVEDTATAKASPAEAEAFSIPEADQAAAAGEESAREESVGAASAGETPAAVALDLPAPAAGDAALRSLAPSATDAAVATSAEVESSVSVSESNDQAESAATPSPTLGAEPEPIAAANTEPEAGDEPASESGGANRADLAPPDERVSAAYEAGPTEPIAPRSAGWNWWQVAQITTLAVTLALFAMWLISRQRRPRRDTLNRTDRA